jgi:hypothetical protein
MFGDMSYVIPLTLFVGAMSNGVTAQESMPMDHSHMHHEGATQPAATAPAGQKKPTKKTTAHSPSHRPVAAMKHGAMPSMDHGKTAPGGDHGAMSGTSHEHGGMEMKGFLGPYPITREGSGTSWLPDSTPHEGVMAMYGDWMLMGHALINGVYDHQGGPRGGDKTFASGMLMGMAERPLGDGTLGFRAMLSPDPFMGPSGYPLLFATGETANGSTPLIDRQHPHDLFMELAGSYSYNLSANSSVFLYAGLPGEPALGPSAFMHRTSGMDIPEAPITHHWLDSTHITFGVVTLGAVLDKWKIEASAFRGREPDQHRYDIESPTLDSFSGRITWNPIQQLSMQVSYGHLHSPEQIMPEVNENRVTASATYTQPFGPGNVWSTTAAWGRKMNNPGNTLDGYLLESELIFKDTYTLFFRAERVREDELLDNTPAINIPLTIAGIPSPIFTVSKVTFGGIYDFHIADHLKFGVGGLVSKYGVPTELVPLYTSDPTSYMVFFRLKVS